MGDEEFIKTIMETHSTSDELSQSGRDESENEDRPGKTLKGEIEADYGSDIGSEEGEEEMEMDSQYEFEKDFKEHGGLFDKDEADSEVENYLDGIEEEELGKGDLKLPGDLDGDEEEEDEYGDESGKGLFSDYGDEDDAKLSFGEYGEEEKGRKAKKVKEPAEDGDDEIENVFAQANEN